MRETKFRAWNQSTRQMLPYKISIMNALINSYSDDTLIFMEYLGVQDINKKEICEGDFVKSKSGFVYEVKWDNKNCAFIFFMQKQGWKRWRVTKATITRYKIEIIGNVYNNPELIEFAQ